ncbi:hypothetical protein [Haloquadratum walsbyi]|jgi:hypothetical protein|uniref:Uncharacterized protein n=1 Tax=Haloquadratum walsbyi (strain DSM 16790 / HBSQ001) TaxID=362976 RepID=Q18EQ1_HALWD|nr:hypothetical protein [Haloquadratum walsbyi]CAJ53570.2 uncharacterized protein HQ_3475A [Haloquadratum walsbyi DSM 16790]
MTQRLRFVHAQLGGMSAAIIALTVLNALTLELFFVISLISLLIVTELTAPFSITPRWRRRLRWVIGIGLAGFGYIVIRRIIEILPPDAFNIQLNTYLRILLSFHL